MQFWETKEEKLHYYQEMKQCSRFPRISIDITRSLVKFHHCFLQQVRTLINKKRVYCIVI